MAGAPGAATAAAGQAILRGARTGTVRLGAKYPALDAERRTPPKGSNGHPDMGGGRSVRAESLSGSGLMGPGGQLHCPPPLPPSGADAPGGSATLDGGAWAPPGSPPPPPRAEREKGGRRGRHDGGGTSLHPPSTLSTFAPTGGREDAASE